jgi:hypothetical protein
MHVVDGVPYQHISDPSAVTLTIEDLTQVPEHARPSAVTACIDAFVLLPVNVTTDALFGARLLRLRAHEHVLLLTTEHLIADGYSMNVLSRDLFAIYSAEMSGQTASLPPLPVQFPDYALWQQRTHAAWLMEHGAYWRERLRGCGRLHFPADAPEEEGLSGYEVMPITIGAELKMRLKEWSRATKTTLVMGFFTAYVALMMRWCERCELVLQYQLDGRMSPQVENTVGYFASVLHLRLQAPPEASFAELLQCVLEEYYTAYEHVDFNYLLAQTPPPAFAGNGRFNWISQEPKGRTNEERAASAAIKVEPVPFKNPVLKQYTFESNPSILLWDRDDEVVGGVYYPARRHSVGSMRAFAHEYVMLIEAMIQDSNASHRLPERWNRSARHIAGARLAQPSRFNYGTDSV